MLIPYGLTPKPQKAGHRGRTTLDAEFEHKRMQVILGLRAQKLSLREIGARVNLSHERVRVLLDRVKPSSETAEPSAAGDGTTTVES